MHTHISWYYRTLIVTYSQLLGNIPPSVVTCSSKFISQLTFVPRDGETNHYLVSLKKSILKRLHSCNGGKTIPMRDYNY